MGSRARLALPEPRPAAGFVYRGGWRCLVL